MRRKEGDKYKEILDAAIWCFAEDGFDKAQISAIAAKAGVATGSIYLYFSGKHHVLCELFARFWEKLAGDMELLDQTDPLDCLRGQLGLFFDRLVANRPLAIVYLREHHRFIESKQAGGLEWHQKCLELGVSVYRQFADPVSAAQGAMSPDSISISQAFLFGGVRSALEFWLGNDLPPDRIRSQMLTMAMASLLAVTQGTP